MMKFPFAGTVTASIGLGWVAGMASGMVSLGVLVVLGVLWTLFALHSYPYLADLYEARYEWVRA